MTTAKAGSATSSINATATSSKRLSGLVSGLDTDTLVQQLTSGTQSKIDKQQQNKQIATWRQQSYREVIKALSEFKSKYFSSSTSSGSISSSSFFNSTSINNTSSFLNVSGSSTAAKNMVITQISQLAHQASLTSSHRVSSGKLTTGAISDSFAQTALGGSSITLTYGGKDYSVALDSDFVLNPSAATTQDQLKQITDTLNYKISKTDGLNGNVAFGIDTSGNVTLSKTDTATGQVTIKDGSDNLLAGLGLTSKKGTAADSVTGDPANSAYFFKNTIAAGSKLEFKINGSDYTLNLSGAVGLPIGGTAEQTASVLQTALKAAISSSTDLKDKLDVTVGADGAIAFTQKDGSAVIVTDGSRNLLDGFGLSLNGDGTGTINQSALTKTYLSDTLAGSTLTFSLSGLNKNITFSETDKASYSTADGLKAYLQGKLDAAYGTGKVSVGTDANGALNFSLTGSTSATDTFTLVSSDKSGVLGLNGALHTYAGESNRINTAKTLADLSANVPSGYPNMYAKPTNLATSLSGDTSYQINVNGKQFTFQDTDSIDSILKTINNDSDANVTVSYSSTTNTFSASAKDGGSTSKVEISDVKGNLAQALFGEVKVTTGSTLASIKAGGTTGLTAADSYTININGTDYTYSKSDSLDSILSNITENTDITATYNTATSTFSFTPKSAGGSVNIKDVSGNLWNGLLNSQDSYNVQAGQDAVMSISFDGDASHATTVTRSSNTFTLDDVNFELLKKTDSTVTADTPIQFTVKNQTDDLSKKISDFFTDYNNILQLVNGKVTEKKPTDGTYLPLTDAQKKDMSETQITNWETQAKKGILQSDSLLDSLSTNLRHAMTDQVSSISSALYQFGIASKDYTANGQLTIDNDKLKAALTNDPDKVAALFTGSDGIAARLQNVIQENINPSIADTGILVQKAGTDDSASTIDNSTLAQNIRDYSSKIKELKTRLESEQDRYYNQFTQLETYLSKMNSYASFFNSGSTSSNS